MKPNIAQSTTGNLLALLLMMLPTTAYTQDDSEQWISLFNGSDLSNWIPKFTGIFYDESFSHYKLLVEYRFAGAQVRNGPDWAFRNNGVMLHGQSPQSMTLEQEFPASIEVQLLGGNGVDERATANVCSPGTHYVRDGELVTQHCINSSSDTFHGDQWVTLEVEVRGDELIRHTVNGEVVFEYSRTQLDESDPDAQNLISQGQPIAVSEGYISLQAESHPTQFRRVELLPLAH